MADLAYTVAAILFIAAIALVASQPGAQARDIRPANDDSGEGLSTATLYGAATIRRVRVIDGDTFEYQGVRIRLWGIDTPELPTPEGVAAKDFLQQLFDTTKLGWYISETKGVTYDRHVAILFIDHVDVAPIMLAAGYAVEVPRYSKGYYGTAGTGLRLVK